MNLQQIRDLVRTQLDLDDTDLPDPLLDAFIQEGFDRVISLEGRWPFYEILWSITVDTGGNGIMPLDVQAIEQLTYNGIALRHVDLRWAIGMFGNDTTAGTPTYWGVLNQQLRVWPSPSAVGTATGFGYRKSADWIATGASAECDCDRRLHIPICWYAASLGYAQQEDEVLEATYQKRFNESSALARDTIMRSWSVTPRQLSWTSYAQPWMRQPQLVLEVPPVP